MKIISFSTDGKFIATGSEDGVVKLWDMATGEELMTKAITQTTKVLSSFQVELFSILVYTIYVNYVIYMSYTSTVLYI